MRKRFPSILDGLESRRISSLICLAVCFGLGSLLGCFFAGALGLEAQAHLLDYLNGYFTVLRDGEVILPSLFSTARELCRWPLLTIFWGFTALGVIGIPAVFAVRGFLFSYSVSVFVRLFGSPGLLIALAIFGVSGLLVLPALFILGVDSLGSAKVLAGAFFGEDKHGSPFYRGYMIRAGECCVLFSLSIALQSWLTPILLRAAAKLIA